MDSLPSEFKILTTADGTPTLAFADGQVQERMHNSKGALAESLYIYGQAIEHVLSSRWPLRVVSIGLGVGYVEMITFALALRAGLRDEPLKLWSFEKIPFLRESLVNWLNGNGSALAGLYEEILAAIGVKLMVDGSELRRMMKSALERGDWQMRREFPTDADDVTDATCILYDAYSSKASPELWQEDLLRSSLRKVAGPQCVLASYAATGAMKRALTSTGFEYRARGGFAGKRESTWGIRK